MRVGTPLDVRSSNGRAELSFQTLEPRDVVEGTGIGLSVVKKIVEGKGGRVWVESVPGAGATFRFTWPKTEKGGAS